MSWMDVETTWERAADRFERQKVSEFAASVGTRPSVVLVQVHPHSAALSLLPPPQTYHQLPALLLCGHERLHLALSQLLSSRPVRTEAGRHVPSIERPDDFSYIVPQPNEQCHNRSSSTRESAVRLVERPSQDGDRSSRTGDTRSEVPGRVKAAAIAGARASVVSTFICSSGIGVRRGEGCRQMKVSAVGEGGRSESSAAPPSTAGENDKEVGAGAVRNMSCLGLGRYIVREWIA